MNKQIFLYQIKISVIDLYGALSTNLMILSIEFLDF
jgi:hypothetical protein